jgi:hypothetical protein
MRHSYGDHPRGETRGGDGVKEAAMKNIDMLRTDLTRRGILKGGGALVISFTAPASIAAAATAATKGPKPLDPTQLDSYLAIHRDGSATVFFGKIDGGQGTDVGIAQIVAEELDLPADKVAVVMGDTATTINQGGASGSFGITWGGKPMRHAGAQARQTLLQMASEKLKTPVEKLTVSDGVISVADAPSKKVTYSQLVGGKFFNVSMKWNGKIGNDLDVDGGAPLKKPADYKIVGKTPKRRDVKPKVFAQPATYVTDIRLPGMLHARVIRPPVAGAVANSVDESSPLSRPRSGTRSARRSSSKSHGRSPRPPSLSRRNFTITFAKRRCGSARSRRRPARSRTRWPKRRKSSRPITNGHSNRMPAWARPPRSRR